MILRGEGQTLSLNYAYTEFCISEESSPTQPGFTMLARHAQAAVNLMEMLEGES